MVKSWPRVSGYKGFKEKIKGFLAGHIVALVTDCAIKLTATCSPMIVQFFDTMNFASTDKKRYNDRSKYSSWKKLEKVFWKNQVTKSVKVTDDNAEDPGVPYVTL